MAKYNAWIYSKRYKYPEQYTKINSLNQNILYTYIDTDMLTVRSDSENNYAVCEK